MQEEEERMRIQVSGMGIWQTDNLCRQETPCQVGTEGVKEKLKDNLLKLNSQDDCKTIAFIRISFQFETASLHSITGTN